MLWLAAFGCGETHTLAGGQPSPAGGGAGSGGMRNPGDDLPGFMRPGPGAGPGMNPVQPTRPQPGWPNMTPTAPVLNFSARLDGDLIVVDVESSFALSALTCSGTPVLEKYDPATDTWSAPRDDRQPDYENWGYYLDGAFVSPSFNEGCDVLSCIPFPVSEDRVVVGFAYEYVKTGTSAPPPDATASPTQVDVVETRPLSGTVRIRLDYFQDDACGTPSSILIELEIPTPDRGVCCPIGHADCSSEGPGGGWAPSLDACSPFTTEFDVMFEQRIDPRGCPVLVENPEVCCGCVDGDGGV